MNIRAIRLLLAYDGTAYSGWQIQPNRPTIQGSVEQAVARITGQPSHVHGLAALMQACMPSGCVPTSTPTPVSLQPA